MFQSGKPPADSPGAPFDVAPVPTAHPAPAAPPSDALRQAHEQVTRSPELQWRFDAPEGPPPDPPRLDWLANLLSFIGPALQWLFWIAVALVLGALLLFIVREVLRARFPERFGKKKAKEAPVEWRPEAETARALLEDADALAAQGRYAEAAHLLLLRSVNDIEGRDARILKPSLTSRDIASLEALPGEARGAFGRIADVVETSLFGGRDVDAEGWAACRRAYADFAFPAHWSAAA